MNVKLKGKLRYFLSICATYLEILLSAILAVALLICEEGFWFLGFAGGGT